MPTNTRSHQGSSRTTTRASKKASGGPVQAKTNSKAKKGGVQKSVRQPSRNTLRNEAAIANEPDAEDNENSSDEDNEVSKKRPTTSTIFRSRFPGLEIEDFEQKLNAWTLVGLCEAITNQASKNSRPPREIKALVKGIRLQYEKQMLMAALMGGLPEVVVWNIV